MGHGILNDLELKSIQVQSMLLDGQPQATTVFQDDDPQTWVCVHGWIMPAHMWLIVGMWCVIGGKAYFNRVDVPEWSRILSEVNPHKTLRGKIRNIVEQMMYELTLWLNYNTDGNKREQFASWYNELIPMCVKSEHTN